jgi:hypothetical protein
MRRVNHPTASALGTAGKSTIYDVYNRICTDDTTAFLEVSETRDIGETKKGGNSSVEI